MKKQKQWDKIVTILLWLGVVLGIIALYVSVSYFWIGFHNLDLAQNMRYLECELNTSLTDQGSDYNFHTWEEMFINGINIQRFGYLSGLLISFVLGLKIAVLILLTLGDKKK